MKKGKDFGITKSGKFIAEVVPGGRNTRDNNQIVPAYVIPSDNRKPHQTHEVKIIGNHGLTVPNRPVIHIAVFARYNRPEGDQLIKDVGYLHAASGNNFHLVLAGYSLTKPDSSELGALSSPKEIVLGSDVTWFYDDKEFSDNIAIVEKNSTWKYKGGLQLIICDVNNTNGKPANIHQMFVDGLASLENVILIDVDELKKNDLFPDFDRFFEALRTIICDIDLEENSPDSDFHDSNSSSGPTWELSDRLGLKKGFDVSINALAKAFKLNIAGAIGAAIKLQNFAVRDISKPT